MTMSDSAHPWTCPQQLGPWIHLLVGGGSLGEVPPKPRCEVSNMLLVLPVGSHMEGAEGGVWSRWKPSTWAQ